MITWAIVALLTNIVKKGGQVSGAGPMLVLSMCADCFIAWQIAGVFS